MAPMVAESEDMCVGDSIGWSNGNDNKCDGNYLMIVMMMIPRLVSSCHGVSFLLMMTTR